MWLRKLLHFFFKLKRYFLVQNVTGNFKTLSVLLYTKNPPKHSKHTQLFHLRKRKLPTCYKHAFKIYYATLSPQANLHSITASN